VKESEERVNQSEEVWFIYVCGIEGSGSNTSYFEALLHSCCLNSPTHEDFPKIKDLPKEKRI